MRKLVFAMAMVGLGMVSSARATDEWLGYICVTSNPLPAACVNAGWKLGECATFRYAPPTPANGTSASFSLIEQTWSENYKATGSFVSTTQVPTLGTAMGVYVSTFSNTKIKFAQTPQSVSATTKFISITGSASNFDSIPGCNITFTASANHKPPD